MRDVRNMLGRWTEGGIALRFEMAEVGRSLAKKIRREDQEDHGGLFEESFIYS